MGFCEHCNETPVFMCDMEFFSPVDVLSTYQEGFYAIGLNN